MKSLVVFLAVVSSAFAIKLIGSAVAPVLPLWNGVRIVGGAEATPHSIPYQAGLIFGDEFCGGSIIGDRWILTSASCAEKSHVAKVILGAHRIQSIEDTQVYFTATKIILHEDWNPRTFENDIALVHLNENINLTDIINVVPLAPANASSYAGKPGVISGWGLTSESAIMLSMVLVEATSTVISNDACGAYFVDPIITPNLLCMDGSQGSRICIGDTGGPITVNGVQVGLTTFESSTDCDDGYPSIFTRISAYREWIQQKTGI